MSERIERPTVNLYGELLRAVCFEHSGDLHLPINRVFRKAEEYAANGGFLASMPQLLVSKLASDHKDKFDYLTSISEEVAGTTPQGNKVLLITHGRGLLTTERLDAIVRKESRITGEISERFPEETHEDQYEEEMAKKDIWGVHVRDKDFKELLNGRLRGEEIPVYTWSELGAGKGSDSRYTIVLDMSVVRKTKQEMTDVNERRQDLLYVARAGSVELAWQYLQMLKDLGIPQVHNLYHYDDDGFDFKRPQGYFISINNSGRLGVDIHLSSHLHRFVAVSSRDVEAAQRALKERKSFERFFHLNDSNL